MHTRNWQCFTLCSIFFGGLFFFTVGLNSQEIIGFDSRFYLFALEMWQKGIGWFPTTYHQPYPDYLATSTVLIYLTAQLFGGLTKFTAVLPSATAAALTLVVTYLIGSLHGKRLGFCAVFLLLLTVTFLKSARSIALDMYPTLFTACCFYLVYSADQFQKKNHKLWLYVFLLLGFIFRGPIGLVIPTGVVCTYYLLDKNFKQFFITGFLSLLLLIICGASLLAIAYHVGGFIFLKDVLRMQVVGRIDNSFLPFYFYFTDGFVSYALAFPLAWLVLLGVFYAAFSKKNKPSHYALLIKLAGWMLIILFGMSLPGDKKVRYVLPMVPAAALLAAYPFIAKVRESYFVFIRKALNIIFALFPLLLLCGTLYVSTYIKHHALPLSLPTERLVLFFLLVQLINGCLYCFPLKQRDVFILGSAALSFIVATILILEPIELYIDRARDFVHQIEAKRQQNHARLVFYREKPDGLPIKYLVNMKEQEQPIFISNEKELLAFREPAFFVASADYFDELPEAIAVRFQVVMRETLGHIKVIVFKRK